MRTNNSIRVLPLLTLAALILTGSALATAQGIQRSNTSTLAAQVVERSAPVTDIGTVVPQGKDFRIELNQEQVSRLYPQYAASQKTMRRGQPVGKEELNESIQRDVLRKIRTLFPNGLPDGTTDTNGTARVKIRITVKLSDPPEFGLSIEW